MSLYVKELIGTDTTKVKRIATDPSSVRPKTAHCVVRGAHAFILRISSFFGLAPLRFKTQSNGYILTISNKMCVYSYSLVTFLVICTILGVAAEINVGVEGSVRMTSRMSQMVSTCDVLVVVVTACVGVYGSPKRMKNMLKFMESVATVDKNLGSQYSAKTERKLCGILLAILIYFLVLVVDDFCFYILQARDMNRHWDVLVNYIGFYLLWCIAIILELQFAFTALSVRARFTAVNHALGVTARQISHICDKPNSPSPLNIFAIHVSSIDMHTSSNVSLQPDPSSREATTIVNKSVNGEFRLTISPCEAISRLKTLHGTLYEVVNQVNDSYGLPLIVILISTLLHLIVTPYFLIIEIIVSTKRVHFLVLQFLWCAIHLLRVFVIVEPCHYTMDEGRKTVSLVCRMMTVSPLTGTLLTRLEMFSRQLSLQNVSYNPLGLCTLDRPLLASVIGSVTTYLVILIQFQRNEK